MDATTLKNARFATSDPHTTCRTYWDEFQLQNLLRRNGVPDYTWARRTGTKTVADLLEEIQRGEVCITVECGQMFRTISVLTLNVDCVDPNDNGLLRLVENNPRRTKPIGTSLGEKMFLGESAQRAVNRALREELGINLRREHAPEVTTIQAHVHTSPFGARSPAFTFDEVTTTIGDSPSYPGLTTRYSRHHARVILTEEYFHPEGYTKQHKSGDPGRTITFTWQKLPPTN